MELIPTDIPDVKIIVPDIHSDVRGTFQEVYNAKRYQALGIDTTFVQDNESVSMRGVIRGLHWQIPPFAQAKLVRVIRGAVWDVAVDLRQGSPTFGKYVADLLTAENGHQFYIPHGFAHGFAVLEDNTRFAYKCDNFYAPQAERGIRFDDPQLHIPWPDLLMAPILSEKDLQLPTLADIHPFFADGLPC